MLLRMRTRPPERKCIFIVHAPLDGRADRRDDVLVAGAAAEIAGQALADLVVGRERVFPQQVGRRHQHAGRAEAALQRVMLAERLLQRVELLRCAEALDRRRSRRRRPARRTSGRRARCRRRAAPCRRRRRRARSRHACRSGRACRAGSRPAAGAARRRVDALVPLTVDADVVRAHHAARAPCGAERAARPARRPDGAGIRRRRAGRCRRLGCGAHRFDRGVRRSVVERHAPISMLRASRTQRRVGATPVMAMRACAIAPSASVSVAATAASAKSPMRRATSSNPQPVLGGRFGNTISVDDLVLGSRSTVSASTKKSRAAIVRARRSRDATRNLGVEQQRHHRQFGRRDRHATGCRRWCRGCGSPDAPHASWPRPAPADARAISGEVSS